MGTTRNAVADAAKNSVAEASLTSDEYLFEIDSGVWNCGGGIAPYFF